MNSFSNSKEAARFAPLPQSKYERLGQLVELRDQLTRELQYNPDYKISSDLMRRHFSGRLGQRLEALIRTDGKARAKLVYCTKDNDGSYDLYLQGLRIEEVYQEKKKAQGDASPELFNMSPDSDDWMINARDMCLRRWSTVPFKRKHELFEFKKRPENYDSLPPWEQAYWDIPKMRDRFKNHEHLRAYEARAALQVIDEAIKQILTNRELVRDVEAREVKALEEAIIALEQLYGNVKSDPTPFSCERLLNSAAIVRKRWEGMTWSSKYELFEAREHPVNYEGAPRWEQAYWNAPQVRAREEADHAGE